LNASEKISEILPGGHYVPKCEKNKMIKKNFDESSYIEGLEKRNENLYQILQSSHSTKLDTVNIFMVILIALTGLLSIGQWYKANKMEEKIDKAVEKLYNAINTSNLTVDFMHFYSDIKLHSDRYNKSYSHKKYRAAHEEAKELVRRINYFEEKNKYKCDLISRTDTEYNDILIRTCGQLKILLKELEFDSYISLASSAWKNKDYEGAIIASDELRRIKHRNYEGYHYKSLALMDKGEINENLVSILEASLTLGPDYNTDAINLSEVYFYRADWRSMIKSAKKYGYDENSKDMPNLLGRFYRDLGACLTDFNECTEKGQSENLKKLLKSLYAVRTSIKGNNAYSSILLESIYQNLPGDQIKSEDFKENPYFKGVDQNKKIFIRKVLDCFLHHECKDINPMSKES